MTEMIVNATTAVQTHGKQYKGDIVQQIKDLYMRKGHRPADEQNIEHLVPTKAALFGLDVRFRVIEKKMLDEKIARSSFNVTKGKSASDVGNRHQYPPQEKIAQLRKTARTRPYNLKAGTCFDGVISDDLNARLPSKISYVVKEKDSPAPVQTEKETL